MKLYVGNCQEFFNCQDIIEQVSKHEVPVSNGHMDLKQNDLYYNEYLRQTEILKSAGYDKSTVEYRHYHSGRHFEEKYVDIIGDIVKATPLMCWLSEIRPGKCTPWHWDINPWEEEHKKLGKLVRYFIFISQPQFGHIFLTEDDAYYMEPQGAIYQYADIHAWHAGGNLGISPKFLMTFTGYRSEN